MSPLVSRILLSILLPPAAGLLYLIAYACMWRMQILGYPYRDRYAWILAGSCMWLFIAAYWILLWRNAVRWTVQRKRLTLYSAGAGALVGAAFGALCRLVDGADLGYFIF